VIAGSVDTTGAASKSSAFTTASFRPAIALQNTNTITLHYTLTSSNPALSESATEPAITVSDPTITSYALPTTHFGQFLWVNDTLGSSLSSYITSGVITAYCNGVAMSLGTGGTYFTAPSCASNLVIYNSHTYGILYSNTAPATILFTAVLNRFVYPVLRF